MTAHAAQQEPSTDEAQVIARIQDALRGLRFGEVTIVVQDGVVVQVERTERVRLRAPTAGGRR